MTTTHTDCGGCVHPPHVTLLCGQQRPDGLICTCVVGPPPTFVHSYNLEYAIDRWHNRKIHPEQT